MGRRGGRGGEEREGERDTERERSVLCERVCVCVRWGGGGGGGSSLVV